MTGVVVDLSRDSPVAAVAVLDIEGVPTGDPSSPVMHAIVATNAIEQLVRLYDMPVFIRCWKGDCRTNFPQKALGLNESSDVRHLPKRSLTASTDRATARPMISRTGAKLPINRTSKVVPPLTPRSIVIANVWKA